jgi:hypothetical protein
MLQNPQYNNNMIVKFKKKFFSHLGSRFAYTPYPQMRPKPNVRLSLQPEKEHSPDTLGRARKMKLILLGRTQVLLKHWFSEHRPRGKVYMI